RLRRLDAAGALSGAGAVPLRRGGDSVMTQTTDVTVHSGRSAANTAARRRLGRVLTTAGLLAYFAFALFPVLWMILLSLKSHQDQLSTYFLFRPTLDAYRNVLGLGTTA